MRQGGAPRHDCPPAVHLDVSFEQAALRQHGAGQSGAVSRADVDLGRALTVEVLVNLLRALAADEDPGLPLRPLVEVGRVGTLDSESGASARQQVADRRPGPGQRLERDDVGYELDRTDMLRDVEYPARLIDEFGRIWRHDLGDRYPHCRRIDDEADMAVAAMNDDTAVIGRVLTRGLGDGRRHGGVHVWADQVYALGLVGQDVHFDDRREQRIVGFLADSHDRRPLPAADDDIAGTAIRLTPEEGAELQRLYTEYAAGTERAAAALQVGNLDRFIDEDAKVTVVVKRIKEILGIAGQPWNAWEQ